MNALPLISVIMPCYNGEKLLARSIDSVLSQTYQNLELIVVNDGSTDNSLAVIKKNPDPRLTYIDQQNSGVCRARNNAISQAKGDFIALLDADDTWEPECLSKLHHAFTLNPDTVIAYCGWQNIGLSGGKGAPFIPPNYENPNKQELLFQGCRWHIAAALTRKYAIKQVGGFDESLRTSEDFLLWLKIGAEHPISLVPEVLSYYHHHDGLQATNNRARIAIDHWKSQQLFLTSAPEFKAKLGANKTAQIMNSELLKKGFECYWDRDLYDARLIFKAVMKLGHGTLSDWKYMLPSLLPISIHSRLIKILG